jgi:hypothetical protein
MVNEALPEESVVAVAFAAITEVVAGMAVRFRPATGAPLASVAMAVTTAVFEPVVITGFAVVVTTLATLPEKVTVSVERTVDPAEIVIIATPAVPSEKTPIAF